MVRSVIRQSFGGGNTKIIEEKIAQLDPDKYSGTIGVSGDAPAGAIKPHYSAFPENPQSGEWLRAVSETTIGSRSLLIGEEWICVKEKTDTTAAVWELSQAGAKKPQYPIHGNRIGDVRRQMRVSSPVTLQSGVLRTIPWTTPVGTGIFADRLATDTEITTNLTDLYELAINTNIVFDFFLSLAISADPTGDRLINIAYASYYPESTSKYSVPLQGWNIESLAIPASKSRATDVFVFRPSYRPALTAPLDEYPLTYGVFCTVSQDSGVDLTLAFAELKVVAWEQ
jgi:hypothetical protein